MITKVNLTVATVSICQPKWSCSDLNLNHQGNSAQLNFSWRTDWSFLYGYCYLRLTSICLVGKERESFRFIRAIANLFLTTSPYAIDRLDTDLTTKLVEKLQFSLKSYTNSHYILNHIISFSLKLWRQPGFILFEIVMISIILESS